MKNRTPEQEELTRKDRINEVVRLIQGGKIITLGASSIPLPEKCPFSRVDPLFTCSLKNKRVEPRMVGAPDYYDDSLTYSRYCSHSSFIGEGYLHCQVFSEEFWRNKK